MVDRERLKLAAVFLIIDLLGAALFAFISSYMGAPTWAVFSLAAVTFMLMRADSSRRLDNFSSVVVMTANFKTPKDT